MNLFITEGVDRCEWIEVTPVLKLGKNPRAERDLYARAERGGRAHELRDKSLSHARLT
jgi:hypothetical protein